MMGNLCWSGDGAKNAPRWDGRTDLLRRNPMLALSRKISVEEPHSLAATQPPRQPSARDSRDPRDAIDSRLSLATSAIGHARRAFSLPRISERYSRCLLPSVLTYVHILREFPMHHVELWEDMLSSSDARMVTDGMCAGPTMGCPGHRRLLRHLQPGLHIIA